MRNSDLDQDPSRARDGAGPCRSGRGASPEPLKRLVGFVVQRRVERPEGTFWRRGCRRRTLAVTPAPLKWFQLKAGVKGPTPMPPAQNRRITRRQFNRSVLYAAGASLAAPAILRGQNLNSKLDIAMVACGGRGGANLQAVEGENIVALCDVNGQAVERAGAKFGKAQRFNDFRKLFDKMEKSIDAVVVSTCEHTHAMATMMALRAG